MSEYQSPSHASADQIGQHIKQGFLNYRDHWQEWILPLGMHALYVGLLVTIPLALAIVASVYESRFGASSRQNAAGVVGADIS